jgi:branched-chain amino acid aminotransferase
MTEPASPAGDPWVWHDGGFVRTSEVRLGPSTQALHYGTGVFEGIRSYRSGVEPGVSNLLSVEEHYQRLLRSARLLRLDLPYAVQQLVEATAELLRRNNLTGDAYIRPIAYKRAFEPGVPPGVRLRGVTTGFTVMAMPMGRYANHDGIRCGVSSWQRIPGASLPAQAKVCGAYANNALAVDEAEAAGYDDAIFLNSRGEVCEASTANIFVVRAGVIATPGPAADILEGVTRATALEILREEAGCRAVERSVARAELYGADEIFLTGTGCEIVPVVEVDGRPVGDGTRGPVTKRVQGTYEDLTRGRAPRYAQKLTRVEFDASEGNRT